MRSPWNIQKSGPGDFQARCAYVVHLEGQSSVDQDVAADQCLSMQAGAKRK